jgi:hypothetical protein
MRRIPIPSSRPPSFVFLFNVRVMPTLIYCFD